jgi:drug/metabolite transporter (DMT)-like permease
MIGSYIGILIMSFSAPDTELSAADSKTYTLGVVYSLIGAVAVSYIFVATNKMKAVNYLVITFYLTVCTQTVCAILMLIEYVQTGRVPFQEVGLVSTLKMLIASTCNFFAVNFLTQANQQGLPATVALLNYI